MGLVTGLSFAVQPGGARLYQLKKNHTQAEVLAVLAASAVCPDENRWSMAEYMAWFDDALSFFTANP
jgi:hypothetical protein